MADPGRDSLEHLKAALSDLYALREEIGRGGMATVYLADDLRHGRPVALKVLHPEVSGSLGATRFLREIQVVAHLNHPHILPLLDSGKVDDRLYYVMPFVQGESLRGQLSRMGRLPLDEAVRIIAEVADGLSYAHSHGLIHRDIKPENILMSSGHAVIADFGIARALDEATDQRLTHTGFVPGTATYMSPEQWAGVEQLDARADQYALGCMTYELLAGEPPFRAPTMHAMMARHMQATPPSLRESASAVPQLIDAAVAKAMAKEPAQRFGSIQDFAAVLKGAAPLPRVAPRDAGRVARLRRVAIPAVAASGLLALAMFAWSLLSNRGAGPAASSSGTRLVVLPLEHTGPQSSAYITDGVTEKLTNSLADIPGIDVIARTSAVQYAGTAKNLREIAQELNVQYVLEGSLQRNMPGQAPGEVTLIAGLYRVSADRQVATYEQPMQESSLFASIPTIALNVAQTLEIDVAQPDRERLAAQPTRNLEAWDYYLRGDEQYNRNWTQAVVDSAIRLYDKATALDPQFALAYAKLARAHAWMNQLRYDLTPERLEKSRSAAERALQLDSMLSEAHLGYGTYLYWGLDEYDRAVAAFSRARDLRPSGTSANQALVAMANVLRRQGRFDEAIANYRRAKDLDPRSHIVWYNLGETLLFTRQYEDARVQLDQVTQLNRSFPEGYVQRARLALNAEGDVGRANAVLLELAREVPDNAWRLPVWNMLRITDPAPDQLPARMQPRGTRADTAAYHIVKANLFDGLGRTPDAVMHFDSARAILERLTRELDTQPAVHAQLGLAFAAVGRTDDALREGRRAMALLPDSMDAFDGPEWRINLARIHAMLGNTDSAAALLRPALEKPSWISERFISTDPVWRRYLDAPAFRSLLGTAAAQVARGR